MARAPLPQLAAPEALQPRARPVDTFVRPAIQESPVQAALKAMSGYSPVLSDMAKVAVEKDRIAQEAAAQGKIGGMTFDEAKKAVSSGQMHEFQSPWFRAAFEKQYGVRAAAEMTTELEKDLATRDLTTTDPDALVAEYTQRYQEGLPAGEFAQSGFVAGAAGLRDKVTGLVNQARIKETVTNRNDGFVQTALTIVEQNKDKPPADLAKAMWEHMQGSRDLLNLGYLDQVPLMGSLMDTLARNPGNEGVIEALGKLDIKGVPLSTRMGARFEALKDGALAETKQQLNDEAQPKLLGFYDDANAGKLDDKAFREWAEPLVAKGVLNGSTVAGITERNLNSQQQAAAQAQAAVDRTAEQTVKMNLAPGLAELARQGHLTMSVTRDFDTQTASGKNIHISTDEQLKMGLEMAADQIVREGQAQKLDPATIRGNVISMYARNGQVDPKVQGVVGTILHGSAGGDVPQSALDALPELAVALREAPEMVNRIASNQANQKFLERIKTGMDYGMDPRSAMSSAIYWRDNRDKFAPMKHSERTSMVTQAMGDLRGWGKQYTNNAVVQRVLERRIEFYYDTGATGDDLRKRAVESVKRTHANVNGTLTDVTGTGLTGPQAAPVLKEAADALHEARPDLKGNVSWIATADGADTFRPVVAGIPVDGISPRSWSELQGLYSSRTAQRIADKANKPGFFTGWRPATEKDLRPFSPTKVGDMLFDLTPNLNILDPKKPVALPGVGIVK